MIALNYSSAASIHSELQRFSIANQIICLDANANSGCGDAGDVPYSYDAYGNLTSDGMKTYAYDAENHLVSVTEGASTTTYAYRCNGLSRDAWGIIGCESDRVSQTVNGITTHYELDQAAGLTQVLSDGTNTYLYGVGRIAQYSEAGPEYFLNDALGSVRQLVDANRAVTLSKDYEPYGEALASAGSGATSYGYSGEMTMRRV